MIPPYAQSSVLACWLGLDQTGLSSLSTSAFLAHVQLDYNPKAHYLPIQKNVHSINSVTPVLYRNHKNCERFQWPSPVGEWPTLLNNTRYCFLAIYAESNILVRNGLL